jgi:hypothetical protein
MTRHCAILLAIALGACPKPGPVPLAPEPPPDAAVIPADAPPPAPLDVDLPRLALRAVQLYEEVVVALTAAGPDCAEAARKLRELQPKYADVATANAKVLHEGRAKLLRIELEPHAARLDAAAKAIASGVTMAECSGERDFQNAFDELVGAP